ncbi:MAG: carboxypeptidase regulatory-like domain-containing protein [Alistipes sp.]|nr:carboxypeptidase regulatory-like domain-containing protein [Alistipes sp.]
MRKFLLTIFAVTLAISAFAQAGGMKGVVVSRDDREPITGVAIFIDDVAVNTTTNQNGEFIIEGLAPGEYLLRFEASEFEDLEVMVRVKELVHDMQAVVMVPSVMVSVDDSAFSELDTDVESAGDSQSMPGTLSASKDIFNNIASYRFSEMRFNVRGYDSQYQDVYLNGIRFNDALTSYGPWSLWSGLNDATRNQEITSGLQMSDFGLGGVAGTTNINARASQLRKGFRSSVVNSTQLYRFRVMLSYASGQLDNGWSYGFSVSTRQGGAGYVNGVYYNAYGYFASAEKVFNSRHRLSATILGAPTTRGAQQASTQEAYDLWGDNYYNPNVGLQAGDERNSRVRRMHEPIAMLNYNWQISEQTSLSVATSVRFGYNGYSALTWYKGEDPRPDYYRRMPSYYGDRLERRMMLNNFAEANDETPPFTDVDLETDKMKYIEYTQNWDGYIDFDALIKDNKMGDKDERFGDGHRSVAMIEERHTDQIDYNFAAQLAHYFRGGSKLTVGLRARVNRTEYYSEVKDLLGGDYWLDVDKFAERDFGSDPVIYQNNMAYYNAHGHAQAAKEGDKYSYDYYAHVRQGQVWAMYEISAGGFTANIGGEVGMSSMWRQGLWEKGLFQNANAGDNRGLTSFGNSDKINHLTYKAKVNLAYQFSGAHSLELNATAMQNAPMFNNAFVSARTRNQITPGLSAEKIYGVDLTYNLRLPWLRARLSAYYTQMMDQSKVISFYDDTQNSFTNFAMSGINKRYMGIEFGYSIPIAWGLSLQGAISYGDYIYNSDPQFTQMIDNSATDVVNSVVKWNGMKVESTPQTAINVGLNFRGPNNWFASVDFNYYDRLYLSMNPMYRTQYLENEIKRIYDWNNLESGRQKAYVVEVIDGFRKQEELGRAYTLSASIGKNWRIAYKYTLGFSLQVNNILNAQTVRTGGYEQMRLNKLSDPVIFPNSEGEMKITKFPTTYSRFDSKYFYMNGINYYLNVYFRF